MSYSQTKRKIKRLFRTIFNKLPVEGKDFQCLNAGDPNKEIWVCGLHKPKKLPKVKKETKETLELKLPEEYLKYFKNSKVYTSRYIKRDSFYTIELDDSLLLMNKNDYNVFSKRLEKFEEKEKLGKFFFRFVKEDISELSLGGGVLELSELVKIPPFLLENNIDLIYKKKKAGLFIYKKDKKETIKLKLPQKYIDYFPDDIIYVSHYPKEKFLLMNESNHQRLQKQLDNPELDPMCGMIRFFRAGITEADFDRTNGIINFPEHLGSSLPKNDCSFEEYDFGLIIS